MRSRIFHQSRIFQRLRKYSVQQAFSCQNVATWHKQRRNKMADVLTLLFAAIVSLLKYKLVEVQDEDLENFLLSLHCLNCGVIKAQEETAKLPQQHKPQLQSGAE